MAVEAAAILPFVLFFCMALTVPVEILRLHGNLQLALWDAGNRAAGAQMALGEKGDVGRPLEAAISQLGLKAWVAEGAGREYLENSPLRDGEASLMLWESQLRNGEDCVDLHLTYAVGLPQSWFAPFSFRMSNHYYGKIWTGYSLGPGEGGDGREQLVYVAEHGRVYHTDAGCSHLDLSVEIAARSAVGGMRNAQGGRYKPCKLCKEEEGAEVYITKEGDKFHNRLTCQGLSRRVYSLGKSQAGGLPPCSRCGKGG